MVAKLECRECGQMNRAGTPCHCGGPVPIDEPPEFTITTRDMRQGAGIGGWHLEWTMTHNATGLTLIYQTRGGGYRERTTAMNLLRLMAEEHYPEAV